MFSLTTVAFAQEGNFENDGTNYDGRILVIRGPRGTPVTYGGRELIEYEAVVIDSQGGSAIVTTVAITASEEINPGDRFDIIGGGGCGAGRISTQLSPR